MANEETIEYVSGLDLGQANEFTALAVLERGTPPDDDPYERPLSTFSVRHLERFPIGTSYAAIFDRVSTLFSSMPLPGNTLIADQSAGGDPVMRSLRRAKILSGYRPRLRPPLKETDPVRYARAMRHLPRRQCHNNNLENNNSRVTDRRCKTH